MIFPEDKDLQIQKKELSEIMTSVDTMGEKSLTRIISELSTSQVTWLAAYGLDRIFTDVFLTESTHG